MNEDLEIIFDMAKESMSNAISHLEKKLINIRAGKANPNMLTNVIHPMEEHLSFSLGINLCYKK